MARASSFRSAAAINIGKSCAVSNCGKPRKCLSRYCSAHTWRSQRWGHPSGVPFSPLTNYASELTEVTAFIQQHRNHEGVSSAVKWFGEWLADAAISKAVPGQGHLRRLSHHAVEPLKMLCEAAALFLYSCRNPHRLPDDARLSFAIAHNVLSLAPKDCRMGLVRGRVRTVYKPIAATVKREVGQHIRNVLSLLFLNIVDALQQRAAKKQALTISLSKSFPQ